MAPKNKKKKVKERRRRASREIDLIKFTRLEIVCAGAEISFRDPLSGDLAADALDDLRRTGQVGRFHDGYIRLPV